jgi:hypothetical protein
MRRSRRLSPLPSRAAAFFGLPSANVSVAAVQQLLGCSLQLLTGAVTAVQHCLLLLLTSGKVLCLAAAIDAAFTVGAALYPADVAPALVVVGAASVQH